MSKLIVGCGYLGWRVARAWRHNGDEVVAVTRSAERGRQFAQEGMTPFVADITDARTLSGLPPAQCVLFAVGYDRRSGLPIRDVYVDGLLATLDALEPSTERLIYVSSTGVYGQTHGEWVNESSTCEPDREGGRACLEAESALESHPLGRRSIILRMAGIYGPRRVPRVQDIRAGRPIAAPPIGYLNLIHVDDAVQAVLAAETIAPPDRILIADGSPVERKVYFEKVAQLCGGPRPTFAPPGDSPADHRASSNKRIDNQRMRDKLKLALRYPSYHEGLAQILSDTSESESQHG